MADPVVEEAFAAWREQVEVSSSAGRQSYARGYRPKVGFIATGLAGKRTSDVISSRALKTEVYRRETPRGAETITVRASIDDEGAEIRAIHERDGDVITDSIPHWGEDSAAGRRWVDQHRDAWIADGYRLVEGFDGSEP